MGGPYRLDSDTWGSESSSSFGERQLTAAEAEGDQSPAVEGLTVSGEARPGRFIQISGWALGGTARCDFAWIRFSDTGSASYIEGENKACFLVTADDVGSFLAVEVTPVADDERKGPPVTIFANEHRKISCDPRMQEQIESIFFNGCASFDASLLVQWDNSFEKVTLEIKKESLSVRHRGSLRTVLEEKFSPSLAITIPRGHVTGFSINFTERSESLLMTVETSQLRDVIVLAMRLFIVRAVEKQNPSLLKAARKQKRKKWCLFF